MLLVIYSSTNISCFILSFHQNCWNLLIMATSSIKTICVICNKEMQWTKSDEFFFFLTSKINSIIPSSKLNKCVMTMNFEWYGFESTERETKSTRKRTSPTIRPFHSKTIRSGKLSVCLWFLKRISEELLLMKKWKENCCLIVKQHISFHSNLVNQMEQFLSQWVQWCNAVSERCSFSPWSTNLCTAPTPFLHSWRQHFSPRLYRDHLLTRK